MSLIHLERQTSPTTATRRTIRVGHAAVSYTHESANNTTPLGRLFLFPGLLGCELSYADAQHHIAQTHPLEVVTMTHSRSLQQVLAPRKQRSVNCHEVIKDSDKVFGSLPKFIIGHSMGGADTASVIAHYLRSGSSGNVVAAGFDSSVGLNGRIPGLGNGIQFLRQEVLTAGGLSGERKRMMLSTFDNYAQNPLLAAAEAFLASTADIKADVDMIQTHMPTLEIFSQFDYLIPPPTNRPGSVVRPEASLGHLALCVEPEVAYEDVALLLDKVV